MQKIVGILVIVWFIGMALMLISNVYGTSNTTAWSPLITASFTNYIPMLIGGVGIFVVIGLLIVWRK